MAESDRPHQTALRAAGLTAAAALLWRPDHMALGGLAPVVVAAVVALLLGAPLSAHLWSLSRRQDDRAEAFRLSARVCATLVTAGVAGLVVPPGPSGTAIGLGLLGLGVVLPRLRSGFAVPLASVAVVVALPIGTTTPWTLLEPVWEMWRHWLPLAIGTGFLLSGTGFGAWSDGVPAVPGWRRGPWLTAGLGLLLLTGASTVWAQQTEAGLADLGPLPFVLVLVTAHGWADRPKPVTLSQLAWLAVAFVWIRSPLSPDPVLFWPLVLLAPALIGGLLVAAESRSAVRVQAAATALVAVGSLMVAWPGFGDSAASAAAAVVPILLILWTGGTRLALGVSR